MLREPSTSAKSSSLRDTHTHYVKALGIERGEGIKIGKAGQREREREKRETERKERERGREREEERERKRDTHTLSERG